MKKEFNEFQKLVISAEQRAKNDAEKLKESLTNMIHNINKMMEESTTAYITLNISHIRNMMMEFKISKSYPDVVQIIKQTYLAKGYKISESDFGRNSFIISWKAD